MPQQRLGMGMEVMVEAMAMDTEDMVAMEAMEAMERGLQKLKLMLSQDTAVDMAVMVDTEVAMEDMVMDMDMARGPLMLKLDMEVMVDMEDMEDTVDIVEDIMDNLYLFSMFHLSLI